MKLSHPITVSPSHRVIGATVWIAAALVCSVSVQIGFAAKFNRVVDLGDAAPAWKRLAGIDGKTHSLAEYKKAKVLVVYFTSNYCPSSRLHDARLKKLYKKYHSNGVEVIAINVADKPGETLDRMKSHAKKHGLSYPYLRDGGQKTAREYGATRTPQFFVLDRQRKIAYMGAFDNNDDESKATKHYLRDAVDAVLAGREPEVTESLQRGCKIEYTLKTKSGKK